MNWILQGNPKRFDIDDYLSRYSTIYWTANRLTDKMKLGDKVFIWRAGNLSGVIAKGQIIELPTEMSNVKNKVALGNDLWTNQKDNPSTIKVGINVFEARLTPEEGMILRREVKGHPIFSSSHIITSPQGTVFSLREHKFKFLNSLWSFEETEVENPSFNFSVYEGAKSLQKHYRKERKQKIIDIKKKQFKKKNGNVFCEVCSFDFTKKYPERLSKDFIEVHHLNPIGESDKKVKTTLEDLILICPNCHRMVHRTKNTEENLRELKAHFSQNI